MISCATSIAALASSFLPDASMTLARFTITGMRTAIEVLGSVSRSASALRSLVAASSSSPISYSEIARFIVATTARSDSEPCSVMSMR